MESSAPSTSTLERPGADGALGARQERQRAVADVRRSLVLEAARGAFFELGLEGASLREIARRAGYTPGAIYSYFRSKEEVYAALLGESLDRLQAAVAAAPTTPAPVALRAQAAAFFGFYRDRPRDLDLGFYLFRGMRPRGLTSALNEALNRRLWASLEPMRRALELAGQDRVLAHTEVTALFAHMAGLLLLSHTGRLRMFHVAPEPLLAQYVDALLGRIPPAMPDSVTVP